MNEEKEITLGGDDEFTKQEWQWLADLITEKLCERGIEVSAFSFSIEVTYNEEEVEEYDYAEQINEEK